MLVDWEYVPEGGLIATDDEAIIRRRRAGAPVQAVFDIERNKSALDGDFWGQYDLVSIALAVIDQVSLAMGLSAGRTWDEALDYATSQARRQRPDGTADEWRVVADRVLVSLTTVENEHVDYVAVTGTTVERRTQRFRLLFLHQGVHGAHLRASHEAINIFVQALDLDVEAAQIAGEAQLRALIERGALAGAAQVARAARHQSAQYQEQIRRIVAETLLDPSSHDWNDAVPDLLDRALVHVKDRSLAESQLLEAVEDKRATVTDDEQLRIANRIIEDLRETRRRHNDLHTHLIGARRRLREALDDRYARRASIRARADLSRDLLLPMLQASTSLANAICDRIVATTGPIQIDWWPTLAVLTDVLCAPPRAEPDGEPVEEPIFADEADEWWRPYDETVAALLGGVSEPTPLSRLLDRAAAIARDVTDADGEPLEVGQLVAATAHGAFRAYAPSLNDAAPGERILVAVPVEGTFGPLDLGAVSVSGTDIVLVPAEVTDQSAAASSEVSEDRSA